VNPLRTIKAYRAIALLQVVIALTLLTMGAGAVAIMGMAYSSQQQRLAGQTSRSTYTTFQQEVLVEGLDPNQIMNPLGGVVQGGSPEGSNTVARTAASQFTTQRSDGVQGSGSTRTRTVAAGGAGGSGERGGAIGVESTAAGEAVEIPVTALQAPIFLIGNTLTLGDFFPNGAAGWLSFPESNPFGTVYRYTVDGSEPTAASSVWNQTVASAMTPMTFPPILRIRATHPDSRFTPSPVVSRSPLRLQMPGVTFGREVPKVNNQQFTYGEVVSSSNRIVLASEVATPLATLYYTLDGSDPAVSGIPYSGPFMVPLELWSATTPPVATLRVANRGPSDDPRFLSFSRTFDLSGITTPLTPPAPSLPSGAQVTSGATVNLTHPIPEAQIHYEKGTAVVTPSSPSGTTISLP
jgi:hypothetical protein